MNKSKSKSINALSKVLKEAIQNPSNDYVKPEFVEALKSQGKLALWRDESLGIKPCALNTLKATAEIVFIDGHKHLDCLRMGAKEAIEAFAVKVEVEVGNKKTKKGLVILVDELEGKISILEQHNRMLVDLVVSLKAKAMDYGSSGSAKTKTLCDREMDRVNAKVGFMANKELFAALRVTEKVVLK
jgi:hypothetical protein|tara:strand:+ start:11559 stop:12116 length:558 start_codon:yes stop_codon:yes gene_type:complete